MRSTSSSAVLTASTSAAPFIQSGFSKGSEEHLLHVGEAFATEWTIACVDKCRRRHRTRAQDTGNAKPSKNELANF
jgi:hypothetical protein